MKVVGQFGTSRVKGIRFRSLPGLRDLLAKLGILDPFDLRPEFENCVAHRSSSAVPDGIAPKD
jgi:hypothetical protein